MLKNKAYYQFAQLYCLLEASEKATFFTYLEGEVLPFGESNALLPKLVKLSSYDRNLPGPKVKKIHERLFPDLPFSEERINLLYRKLLKALRQFLAFWEFWREPFQQKKFLTQALARRANYELLKRSAHRQEKAIWKRPVLDTAYYRDLADLHQLIAAHPDTPRIQPEVTSSKAFQQNLDLSYVLAKLVSIAEQRNRSKILRVTWDPSPFEEIKKLATRLKNERATPLIDLYLNLIALHAPEPDPVLFEKVKCSFYLNWHLCGEAERFSIFAQLINYTNAAYRQGMTEVMRDQLLLYQMADKFGWLVVDNRISDTAFQNAVAVAVHLQDYAFALAFIDRYEKNLPASEKEFAVHFAMAHYFFYQDKFAEALEKLQLIHTPNALKDLMKSGFQIRCLYELSLQNPSYQKVLTDKLNNFGRQLGRNRIAAGSHRLGYFNMVKMIRQLNRKRFKNTIFEWEKKQLLEKITSLKPLKATEWLLKKAENI